MPGVGTTDVHASPVQVTTLGTSVVDVVTAALHACARKSDDGSNTDRPAPVEVTGFGASVVDIQAGEKHTCALLSDGTLWCWGWSSFYGQVGDGQNTDRPAPVQVTVPASSDPFAEVRLGTDYTCARLETNSSVWCWGDNNAGTLGTGSRTTPTPALVTLP